jgi:NADH-ubiquinone oxidoreductase chain 4
LVNSLLSFYLFFEISILPVIILILGWGYQPERIRARFYIIFYTLFGSLPLLLIIVFLEYNLGGSTGYENLTNLSKINRQEIIFFTLAFSIKLPVYLTHLWLPKAHVEAPVSGSIILAGLILKLGGLGIIYFSFIVWNSQFILIIIISTIIGRGMLSLLISRLTDIKVIIAYSSVVHIRLVYICSLIHSPQGLIGRILMILCHGITSPGIFACANIMYERRHSRRSIINKGKISTIPIISLFWFLLIIINFGGPFSINLIREILLINSINSLPIVFFIFVSIICFFSAIYNLLLYATLHQGVIFFYIKRKIISLREALILNSTIIPGIIILLRFQLN